MQPEKTYHVYNRANGRENLFIEDKNFNYFLDKYFEYINPIAKTYAYCLMPNHFHIMLKVENEEDLLNHFGDTYFQKYGTFEKLISRQFANLFSCYTQSFNKVYQRTGSLFQRSVKAKEISNNSYFTQLILYIHANPVKHGFVAEPYEWPYSSIHQLATGQASRLQSIEVIDWFGDTKQFKLAHTDILPTQSVFD